MKMPDQLEIADKFGSRLGIEYGTAPLRSRVREFFRWLVSPRVHPCAGFMSTTTNKKIAIKYGQDWVKERGLNHVLELPMDSLNREPVTSLGDSNSDRIRFTWVFVQVGP